MSKTTDAEIKCWLQSALKGENLLDFTVARAGTSEKGDGYMGEIVFVDVSAKTKTHASKTYHLVLKCSKNSQALRESIPIQAAFENEIYLYENVIPTFTNFQRKRGVSSVFSSVPKYYGSYTDENREVLVLENLKSEGYYLFDRKVPLPTKHLKLILQEYGKLHAISAAMQDQEPEKFRQLIQGRKNVWKLFADATDTEAFFGAPMDEVHDLLKSDLCESTAQKLKNFKSQVTNILRNVINEPNCFSVINHGDCWNNNFMFKSENEDQNGLLKVAMLDWQTTKFANPAMDVSYFIFACSSEEDLDKLEDLLKFYYDSFSNHVKLLKSDPDKIYSFSQFLEDFKLYGKYGVMLTVLAVKVALSDKEEAPDLAETVNGDFAQSFSFKNKNQDLLKNRMFYIVKKVAEQGIF